MSFVRITRKSDGISVAEQVLRADSIFSRMKGLLGRTNLSNEEGLWIVPCNSVHTWFMQFAIDVVYLDRELKILKIHRDMKPWGFDLPQRRARSVLELASGRASQLREGDYLCIS